MIKRIAAVALALVLCLSLSGCEMSFSSVDSLMRPPKLSGENSLLQKAFEQSLDNGESVVMKTPLSGVNRSSYLLFDIDNDETDEALVFYSDPSVDEYACASVFKFDGEWKLVSNIKGQGDEIYSVTFADINGDGTLEIILCWTYVADAALAGSSAVYSGGNNRIMTIYSYNKTSTALIKSELFSNIFVADFNNDRSDEILLVNVDLSKSSNTTIGKFIGFDSDYSVKITKEFSMTRMIEILNIVTDTVIDGNSNYTRVYIDGAINDSAVITDVIKIKHDDFSISFPFTEEIFADESKMLRDVRTYCSDIDSDGIIEIPSLEKLKSSTIVSDDAQNSAPLNLTVWSELDGDSVSVDFKCVLNSSYGYLFKFPDEWETKVTAFYNRENYTLRFWALDENMTVTNELFSIRAVTDVDWDDNHYGYTKFSASGATVFGYSITSYGESFGVTPEFIENHFSLYN